jgi:predicted PurR-regulated permease PerM
MTGFEVTPRQRRWLDALLILATIIAFLVAAGLVWDVVIAFGDVILIFFLAWLIAFMIGPLAAALARLIPAIPRAVAVVVVYVLIFIALFALIFIVADTLVRSINEFIVSIPQIQEDLPEILAPIQDFLDGLGLAINVQVSLDELLALIRTQATDLLGPLQQIAVAGIGVVGNILFIVILSLYIAVDRPRIVRFLNRLVPPGYKEEANLLQESVSRSFGGFIRGQVILGLAYAGVALVTSLLLGLGFLPLTTVAAGFLMAIPFFGPFVAWVPPVLVAIFFDQSAIVPALVVMGAGWFVVMNILQPRLMSGAVGLHPVVVLASVIIGGKIAGVPGAIFGIPIAAIVSAFFFYYLGHQRGGSVAERAARRLEDREGRHVRVPREPSPGLDADVPDDAPPSGQPSTASAE